MVKKEAEKVKKIHKKENFGNGIADRHFAREMLKERSLLKIEEKKAESKKEKGGKELGKEKTGKSRKELGKEKAKKKELKHAKIISKKLPKLPELPKPVEEKKPAELPELPVKIEQLEEDNPVETIASVGISEVSEVPEFPEKKEDVKAGKGKSSKSKKKGAKAAEGADKKELEIAIPKLKSGKQIEKYGIEVDGAKVVVEITKDEMGAKYNLHIPKISDATKALLNDLRNDLVMLTTVSMKELTDPTAFFSIKMRFMKDARKLLSEKLPNLDEVVEKFLIGMLMQEMLGLGKVEFLVADPTLEEIVLPSAKEPIRVFSKKYGWLLTNIIIDKEEDIINYSNIIARRVGRQITGLNPLRDAHLVTGDRINAVLYPIDTKGNTITIRKFARDPFTIIDFINNKTCDFETAALIWLGTEYEMNILISGGNGSGKTSFLNACMPFIPPNQRIISIEDTRELMLPEFLYWT